MHQVSTVVRHDGGKRSVSPENQIRAPSFASLGAFRKAEKLAKPIKEASSSESNNEEWRVYVLSHLQSDGARSVVRKNPGSAPSASPPHPQMA